jgi:hypothetical protein
MRQSYLLTVAVVAAVLLVGAAWRVSAGGASYLEKARAIEAQDLHQAVLWYGEAMRSYVPLWHPHVKQAHAALVEMARRAESHENPGGAVDAWREIHASLNAVRSFYQPYPEWLKESEEEILRLMMDGEMARKPRAAPVILEAQP